ncbi:MAG: hypothetical protein C4560_11980 [Nitrospiraceae bacterium]|nr:MAG: hypothetical protein C4560_11980 [Nitrospiraceae bacterium]
MAVIADPSRVILSEAKNLVFKLWVNSMKQSASVLINIFEIASSLTFLAMTLKTDFFSIKKGMRRFLHLDKSCIADIII